MYEALDVIAQLLTNGGYGAVGVNNEHAIRIGLGALQVGVARAFKECAVFLFKAVGYARLTKPFFRHRGRDVKKPGAIGLKVGMHPGF